MTLLLLLVAQAEPSKLENGLTVFVRPVPGAKQAALVVLYSVGEHHDPEGRSGLSHLVEHLYLLSAAGGEKARDFEELLKRYPLGANAQTGDRYTSVAAVFPAERLEAELREAAARMGDLRIEEADLERERGRLLAEVENMFGGIPALGARNLAAERLRPAPRGGRRGGEPAQVKSIGLEDVRSWWKKYYKPRNAVLSVAGGLDEMTARGWIEKYFGPLAAGEPAPEPGTPGEPRLGALEKRPGKEGYAAVAYAAPAPADPGYPAFLLLASRLAQRAGKLGGEFPASFAPLDDASKLTMAVPLKPGETAEAAVARLDAFVAESLSSDPSPADAIATYGALLGLMDVPDRFFAANPYLPAFRAGRLHQLGVDSARLREKVKAVTPDDLRAARRPFTPPHRAAAALLPP